MGRRAISGRRSGVIVPGARAVLLANWRKMAAGFCTCSLPPLDRADPGPCGPHTYLATLESGDPFVTSPRSFTWALSAPAALDDLGAVVAVHEDDRVTVPDDDD